MEKKFGKFWVEVENLVMESLEKRWDGEGK